MKKFRKILSVALAVCMLASMSTSVMAESVETVKPVAEHTHSAEVNAPQTRSNAGYCTQCSTSAMYVTNIYDGRTKNPGDFPCNIDSPRPHRDWRFSVTTFTTYKCARCSNSYTATTGFRYDFECIY